MMVKAAQSGNFSLGVMFLPHPSGIPYGGVIVGGASLWMINTNNTQREEATWKFLKFLESTDAQIEWSTGTGYFPVNKNSIIKLMYQGYYAKNPPYLVTVLQLLMSNVTPATSGGATGAFPQIRTAVDNAFGKMFTKAMTPQQALQWAQDQANQAIANYNSLY
jgi:sn-glycerol 3-phosphate transport system substrate-binding protein